jgi:hypothetical protein
MDEAIRVKAESLWDAMDNKERAGIKYGMFPTNKMVLVEEQGFDCYSVYLALMDCAEKDGSVKARYKHSFMGQAQRRMKRIIGWIYFHIN